VVTAKGVLREFKIACEQGCVPIPICFTDYAAKEIYREIEKDPLKFYTDIKIFNEIKKLETVPSDLGKSVDIVINILKLTK